MKSKRFFLLFLLTLVTRATLQAGPITAFSYQGRLNHGTNVTSGVYDFRLGLYDAVEAGEAVVERLDVAAVPVTNGLFTLSLDFGESVFDGEPRWLQIAVRPSGGGVFTTLAPRQALTPTPYALQALNASQATAVPSGAISSAMLADGAVTSAKLGTAAVKPANIDDGGSVAYDELMGMARGLVATKPLPFNELSLVTTNSGAVPTLTFRLDGSSFGKVLGFTGREGLSEVYEYVVEVLTSHPELNPESQVGRQGVLSFARNGRTTTFAGVITACSQASYGGGALYTFRLEPTLAFLGLSSNYRIYQDQTVPDLVSALYREVTSNTLSQALSGSYDPRALTMQFAETDLNFFNRLLEYEGIFYFFREEATPTLVLGDGFSSYLGATYDAVPYYGDFPTNPHPPEECLRAFQKATRESTKAAALTGYDFTAPRKNLLARASASPGRGETFEFDAVPTETSVMEGLARVRLESQRVERNLACGAGNAADLRPGYTFTLEDRTGSGASGSYVVTAVRHAAFRRTTNGVSSLYYGNQIEVLPAATPYRPARTTPRPVAPACTAVVTGPAGEDIWTDKYGRVKVQFHWDRYGTNGASSSGWIRVASHWAGKQWGMISIPRIGQEVLVEFVNGDPDQPVITGSFYNADQMPPYELPANATKSGIKTRSSKAGTGDNFNEISFEDKKGSEQLFIHAEKNFDREVENDMTSWVGHDATSTVDHDVKSTVKHDLTLSVSNNLKIVAGQGIGINTGNDPAIALKVGGTVAATNFQGNGSGLSSLPAAGLTGTISDARLSANVGLLAGSQTFTGAKTFNNAAFTGSVTLSGAAASLTVAAAAPVTFYSGPLFNAATPFTVTSTARIANLNAAYAGVADSASNADTLDGLHASGFALAVHGHDAAALVTGTVNDTRLSLNVPRLDGSQSFSGNNTFLGRVAVGGAMGLDTLTINGTARLNNYDLFLRANGDLNHGLGWYGSSKLFGGVNLDGPVLYGCDGGGLGTACSSQNLALRWRNDGNVMIDPSSLNAGALLPGLTFGSFSGEGMSSKRTAGGNQYGLDFYTHNTNRLSITQSGLVGIGTAAPVKALDVIDGSGAGAGGNIHVGANTAGSDPKLIHFGDLQSDGLGYVYLGERGQDDTLELRASRIYFNTGNVGIGITNPATALEVAGTVKATRLEGDGSGLSGISGVRFWQIVTNTSVTAVANRGYIANSPSRVNVVLPASATLGDIVRVTGMGSGGWRVDNTALGTVEGTSLSSIELLCAGSGNWRVLSAR